ncbi:MAG: ABC transporter ATP-binding protein/permease [Prevotellaceae bacterium]|jgi:subfamily B ATP-binding cassette protein MsbA|nr:ABC transporter ATP-binding protein/permease [Prevotellaceae bacterium]
MAKKASKPNINKKFSLSYFGYFYKIIGKHTYTYLILNLIIGLLDGFGLTMFVPILQVASGDAVVRESLGGLSFILDFFEWIGLPLTLLNGLIIMVLLFVFKGIASYIRTVYFTWLRQKAGLKMQTTMVRKFESVSYEGYTKLEAGRIQSVLIGQANEVINAMTTYFNVFQEVIMVFAYMYIAFTVNWKFAIMVLVGAYFSNFFFNYLNKVTKDYSRKVVRVSFNINGDLIQSIQNFKYLKATDYFKILVERIVRNIVISQQYSFKIAKLGAIVGSAKEPIVITVIAAVTAAQVYIFGDTFTSMMVALIMFYRSLNYLVRIQTYWNQFIGQSASIDAVEEMSDEFLTWKEPHFDAAIKNIGNIDIKNLHIQFGEKVVLDNVNISIPQKSSVAFVGESGAGKTTLANVVCGLQIPHGGEVVTEGKNIYETNLTFYRAKIGYVTQEPVIFNDTIFNNITFWAEKTPETLEKFWCVLDMVSMKEFVEDLVAREDATLGHNGILVSGGQKQRISIARELYKDVELLIMDEATSALDSETENHIKESIDLMQGKFTMIIIAHRLSTIKNVDTVYLLENGVVTGSGSFKDLQKTSERFKKMVELQEL